MCDCFYLVSTSTAKQSGLLQNLQESILWTNSFIQTLGKTATWTGTLLHTLRKHAHLARRRTARVRLFLFSSHQHHTSRADCCETRRSPHNGPTLCPNSLEKHGFGPTLCSNLPGNTTIWPNAELRVCDCFHLVPTSTAQAKRIAAKTAEKTHFGPSLCSRKH